MRDLLMTQMGFWTAFTIIFIIVVTGWFIYKVAKLSGQKPPETKD